jgi:hypothetical protein
VGGTCDSHGRGEESVAYRVLVGNPEGKRPLGGPRHRWVDEIRTDVRERTMDSLHHSTIHLRLGLSTGLFPSGFPTKTL